MYFRVSYLILAVCGFVFGMTSDVVAQGEENPLVSHMIVGVSDETATIFRANTDNTEEPLTVGALVSTDDLINPGTGRVVVLCSDLTWQTVIEVIDTSNCEGNPGVGNTVITWAGVRLYGVVRSGVSEFPYVITPRDSLILDGSPTIRWAGIEQADAYRVVIRNALSEVVLEETATTTEMPYPEGAAALGPGVYGVSITPLDANGNEIGNIPADPYTHRFCISNPDATTNVLAQIDAVNADRPNGVNTEALTFVEALVLYRNGYRAAAIEELMKITSADFIADPTLENLPSSPLERSPRVYIVLGNIYNEIGIPAEANRVFQAAVLLAETSNQTVDLAEAYIGLSNVEPNRDRSEAYRSAADILVRQFGLNTEAFTMLDASQAERGIQCE